MKKVGLFVFAGVIALLLGVFARHHLLPSSGLETKLELVSGTWLQPAKVINEFQMENQHGETFSQEDLQGKWSLMFFGFINCPDICPITLQLLKNVKADLNAKNAWQNKQVVFVTVDPARDTPDKMKPYVEHFDSEFVAVRGNLEKTQKFAKEFSMPFVIEPKNKYGGYNVAHNGSILLLNPKGQLAAIFSTPHDHSKLVYDLLDDTFSKVN